MNCVNIRMHGATIKIMFMDLRMWRLK